jgi:hypothetical protein
MMVMDTRQIPKDPTNPRLLEDGVPDWPLIVEGALGDAELHAALGDLHAAQESLDVARAALPVPRTER